MPSSQRATPTRASYWSNKSGVLQSTIRRVIYLCLCSASFTLRTGSERRRRVEIVAITPTNGLVIVV